MTSLTTSEMVHNAQCALLDLFDHINATLPNGVRVVRCSASAGYGLFETKSDDEGNPFPNVVVDFKNGTIKAGS